MPLQSHLLYIKLQCIYVGRSFNIQLIVCRVKFVPFIFLGHCILQSDSFHQTWRVVLKVSFYFFSITLAVVLNKQCTSSDVLERCLSQEYWLCKNEDVSLVPILR